MVLNSQFIRKNEYESKEEGARQENILAVAQDVPAEVGYEGTTIRGLAESARVVPGTLYEGYNSKDELIVAAVQELLTELGVLAQGELQSSVDRLLAICSRSLGDCCGLDGGRDRDRCVNHWMSTQAGHGLAPLCAMPLSGQN